MNRLKRPAWLAAVVMVTGSALLAAAAPVGADTSGGTTSTIQVGDAAEAWYTALPVDTCSSPVGCPSLPSPTAQAYPAGTLHVSESVGQAVDSLYIQPDLASLPAGDTPVSGQVVLPLDSDASSGTTNAATATVEACLITSPFPDGAAGSTDAPPPTDCRVSAPVTAGTSSFGFDLTPFLKAWNQGFPEYGIGLLPTVPSSDPIGTWHVALNGRDLAGVPHITSTLDLPAAAPSGTTAARPTPPVTVPAPPAAPSPSTSLALGISAVPVTTPPITRSAGPVLAPPVPPTTVTPATIPIQPAAVVSGSKGFQYPEVLLLPLLFVAGLLFVTRLLTSDATPKRPRKLA